MVNPNPGATKRSASASLSKNRRILEDEDYSDDKPKPTGNTVTVGGERLYNIGNFESVRIKVEYCVAVEDDTEARAKVRILSKRVPTEITDAFDIFCERHQVKRKREER